MKCAIVGAGEIGLFLCDELLQRDHEVVLIESNTRLAKSLSENLMAKVVSENGTLADNLVGIDIQNIDAFMAVTSDDNTNLLACSVAKVLGVEKTICRIKDRRFEEQDSFNYKMHFGIDSLISPSYLSALEIAKSIRTPHGVITKHISRGKVDVQSIRLSEHSKYVGKALKFLNLGKNIRIGYIQRRSQFIVPTKDTVLQSDDLLTIVGENDAIWQMRPNFSPEDYPESINIALCSAGEITASLISLLNEPRFKIKVIEENFEKCEQLAKRFPQVSVINGNPTSIQLLKEECIDECDYFVVSGKNDEQNIMSCLQAKKLGAKSLHLVVNKYDYEAVFDQMRSTLGIKSIVSPRLAISQEIWRTIFPKEVSVLGKLNEGDVGEILEIKVRPGCVCEGIRLVEFPWPPGTIFLVLTHQFRSKLPSAEDVLIGGDVVVAVVSAKNKEEVIRLLTSK